MNKTAIKISESDNVAVALCDLREGECVLGVSLKENVGRGHKFALERIPKGSEAVKYGYPIGIAKCDIECGCWVHTHNLQTGLSDNLTYEYRAKGVKAESVKGIDVYVYPRKDGNVGIRNDIWIIPTVGCVNSQARVIADRFNQAHLDIKAYALTHPYGCSQTGDDHERTVNILRRLAKHPNAGGVLVLGLGCENNRLDVFKDGLGDYDTERTKFLVCQDVGDEIAEGLEMLEGLYLIMQGDKRVQRDIGCLKVGLKCGGSDGLSGITGNPLVGMFSDWLIARGGATVLTEVPEMFGAEQLLMERAANREVFDKIVKLINEFKDYYRAYGQPIYENPSPGNKQGGITTLEDKSLGCTQKSGSYTVEDVVFDGCEIGGCGLQLLNGPGNDIVAVTNLTAAGCHLVLFTTGRGTPLGGFIPTLKISTNSALAQRKANWIDFDAGGLAEDMTFDEALDGLTGLVCEVVNGKPTKNELSGSKDIAIFKTGVTL